MKNCITAAATLLAFPLLAAAGPVTGLTTFTPGSPARAAEVNTNFAAVKTAVDENHQRLATVETQLASPQMQALLAAAPYLSVIQLDGHPVVRISGANVQIVNGMGDTRTVNGTGNLILGYDEARTDGTPECSVGYDTGAAVPVTNQPQCEALSATWSLSHKSGSHNVVIGALHNYPSAATLIAGERNTASFLAASVTGGNRNRAANFGASIAGGSGNRASGLTASVAGGSTNIAPGELASIAGGLTNEASALGATVAGGQGNRSRNHAASVSGGTGNNANGSWSHVSGGEGNTATGDMTSILGGTRRTATAPTSTVPPIP
jgi:hypothetical protein